MVFPSEASITRQIGEVLVEQKDERQAAIRIHVFGNDQTYNLHLRTLDLQRPWESFRQSFRAPPTWTTVRLRFFGFIPPPDGAAAEARDVSQGWDLGNRPGVQGRPLDFRHSFQ
ncbi:CIA30 family protein [Tropicimonas marinistellae]|uniref:CIA30 family protein n=1 Tax=Tropicimonas marinistellae TaxID=1739787 RepID=UPI0013734B60